MELVVKVEGLASFGFRQLGNRDPRPAGYDPCYLLVGDILMKQASLARENILLLALKSPCKPWDYIVLQLAGSRIITVPLGDRKLCFLIFYFLP